MIKFKKAVNVVKALKRMNPDINFDNIGNSKNQTLINDMNKSQKLGRNKSIIACSKSERNLNGNGNGKKNLEKEGTIERNQSRLDKSDKSNRNRNINLSNSKSESVLSSAMIKNRLNNTPKPEFRDYNPKFYLNKDRAKT